LVLVTFLQKNEKGNKDVNWKGRVLQNEKRWKRGEGKPCLSGQFTTTQLYSDLVTAPSNH